MKERIDVLLVDRRLVDSRTKAQWLIKNGYVVVNDVEVRKPGKKIDNLHEIVLKADFPYVGKGGIKLESAIKEFSINVEGKVCADIGASVGGFTDCLIKQGASKVYAIDIATDFLHPSLRCEKMEGKVVPILGVDAREVEKLEENVDICTIDVTFSSLRAILPKVKNYLKPDGDIIALVKPLFETEFHEKKRFEIVDNYEDLYQILVSLKEWCLNNNTYPYHLIKSPLKGKGGSTEFFYHLKINNKSFDFDFRKQFDEIIQRN